MRVCFSFLLLLCVGASGFAQKKRAVEYSGFFDSYYNRGPLQYQGGIGVASLRSDLNDKWAPGDLNVAFRVGLAYQWWARTLFSVDFHYMGLNSKATIDGLDYKLTNTGKELTASMRLYLVYDRVIKHAQRDGKHKLIQPYVTVGAGLLQNKPTLTVTNGVTSGEVTRNSQLAFVVPVGLGADIWVSNRVAVVPELSYRFTFQDKLDALDQDIYSGNNEGVFVATLGIRFNPAGKKKPKKYSLSPPEGGGNGGGSDPDFWEREGREDPRLKHLPKEEPAYEDDPYGDDPYGDDPYGDDPYADPYADPSADPAGEEDPYYDPYYDDPPADTDPSGGW